MGCGSSSLADNTPPPIDWSRYEPTGDVAADQRRAQELFELQKKHWQNEGLSRRCLTAARRLDPNDWEIALRLAENYHYEAANGDPTLQLPTYAKAERCFSDAYRLAPGKLHAGIFDSWASVVLSQGAHRQKDHDRILQLKPRSIEEIENDADAACSERRYDDAIALYRSAYERYSEPKYLTSIVDCYIASKGLASPEARGAAKSGLRKLAPRLQNATGVESARTTDAETFLKSVLAASPLYEAAQAKEKQGDLAGAAEAGNAAYWAMKHHQIVDFQYRVLTELGRFKDCERMLDLERRNTSSRGSRREIPLFLEQGRYTKAHALLMHICSNLPKGPERQSLVEVDQQCMASRAAAMQAAKSTIEDSTVDGRALAKAALFFYFEEEHELAIQALKKAIAREPNVGQYHGDLADSFHRLNKTDEATLHYKKALDLDSSSLQRLIWSVCTGGDPKTAEYFADILKWDPHAENFAWFGSTFTTGTYIEGCTGASDAITAYETALGLQPDHPAAAVWQERLDWIARLVKKTLEEREMRRLQGDPISRRLLALQNYQSFGYGVSGSWNQFNTPYWQAQVAY